MNIFQKFLKVTAIFYFSSVICHDYEGCTDSNSQGQIPKLSELS